MEFILLIILIFGVYALHTDHKILSEGIDQIIEHLGIEEEQKEEPNETEEYW